VETDLSQSPQGPEWVAWKRASLTQAFLQAIRLSIEDAKSAWANGNYGSVPSVDAAAIGSVNALQKMEAWIDGIAMKGDDGK
jgi:hypothetical protein